MEYAGLKICDVARCRQHCAKDKDDVRSCRSGNYHFDLCVEHRYLFGRFCKSLSEHEARFKAALEEFEEAWDRENPEPRPIEEWNTLELAGFTYFLERK